MEQKLTKLNDDIIASKIEQKMDQISEGKLTSAQAIKILAEIEQLIAQMQPEARQTQMMYFDMFKDRVAHFYLQNNDSTIGK